jgi:hypothetical protein
MSIAMLPFTSLVLVAPAALPAARLRLRTYSLCLACFFALINTSLPRLALFVPAYERPAAVPKLDRTRGVRTALPLARGILEVPPTVAVAVAVVGCDDDDDDEDEDVAVAARCAPSLAMMREREIRGLRVEDSCPGRDVDEGPGIASGPRRLGELCRSPVVVAASAVAAAVSEVGLTGGGMTCLGDVNSFNGVVNIFPPVVVVVVPGGGGELTFPLRGLFVIASRTELRGGVLARCATMLPVLDLTTAVEVTVVVTGLRAFARELAVGASSLDMVPLELKMDALSLPPLASAVLPLSSGMTTCAGFVVTPPLRWAPKGCVDERETPRTL